MPEERWAEIEDFPDYAVSTEGRVKNLRTQKILRPRRNSYEYGQVALRRDGQTHERYVHRLVAKAFITGYRDDVQVRHVNGNNDDNVIHLRFRNGVRMGTLVKKPRAAMSRRIRIIETGHTFATVESCARFIEGDVSSIYRVLRGERRSHKGLTFEYDYEEL